MIFFGTADFAVTVLETLKARGILPTLVVTETDKPKGRGHALTSPPVKIWATQHAIPSLQPETLRDESVEKTLREVGADVFLVAEYGKLLPPHILDIPPHGVLNIHPSLLPKYRGASPIRTAIREGGELGVCVMKLDHKMDHGPTLGCKAIAFENTPDADEAESVLAITGAQLYADLLPKWIEGTLRAEEQEHEQATFTKKITKEDGFIDLTMDANENWRRFKAYRSSPGVYFIATRKGRDLRVKITDAKLTTEGGFEPQSVIPENKREMPYQDFLRGNLSS